MICGNKQDIEKILPYVSEGLQKALQYIKETNFAEVKNGEYEIDGRDVFVRSNARIIHWDYFLLNIFATVSIWLMLAA